MDTMITAWRLIDAWRSAFGEYSGEAFIVAVIVAGALIWRLLLLLQQSGSLTAGELRQQVRERFGAEVDAELARRFGGQK